MCVLIGINQLGFGSVVPVLPLYARSFGVSQAAIGLSIAVYGLARFLVAMPVGQLSDRLGRRPALALGGLITAAGNLLCAYVPNYPTFVAARFVAGVGAAFVLTAVRSCSPTSRRPPCAGGRGPSTRARSCSPWASGPFLAACWRSGTASRLPSWSTRSWAAWPPSWGGYAFPRQ